MKHREVDELLQNQELPTKERQQLITRLRKVMEPYEIQPQNRDGRGVRHRVRKLERTTVRHIASALRFSQHHPDPQIRHKAKEFLRSIPHHSFPTLATRASAFMGVARKASRRLKEQRRQESGRVVVITESLSLEEVRSLTMLRKVGKKLRMCVAKLNIARSRLEHVRDGTEELWVVRFEDGIVGLLSVSCERTPAGRRHGLSDTDWRTITECNGFDNESFVLSHDVALEILKRLQINQIDAETFSSVGAFPIFLHESIKYPIPMPIMDGNEWHYVWRTKHQVVIATSKRRPVSNDKFVASKMHWSRFSLKTSDQWNNHFFSNYLEIGKVLTLILKSPGFYSVISELRGPSNDPSK